MSSLTIIFSAIIFLTAVGMHLFGIYVPTYLGSKTKTGPSEFQKEMVRHGHSYTRGLLCLCLLGQIFLDYVTLSTALTMVVRFAFPIGGFLMAISYFYKACSRSEAKCSCMTSVFCRLGRLVLGGSMIILAIGLILSHMK